MAFRTLFKSGYKAFLEENGDRGDTWFFVHIPKTAGSSFRAEMSAILKPDYNVHIYDDALEAVGSHEARLEAAMAKFEAARQTTRFRFVSGHVTAPRLAPLLRGPKPIKLFTILRDPVKRVISDYRYQSTPQHPDHVAFRERYPSIEAYLDNPGEANKMHRYLAPAPDAGPREVMESVLDSFAFVGTMEMYDLSFSIVMDLIGEEGREPSLFLRRTDANQAAGVTLTPELEERIRSVHAKDVALYDALTTRLEVVGELKSAAAPPPTVAPKTGFTAWRKV